MRILSFIIVCLTFVSCTKEPTACFTSAQTGPLTYQFTNCSEGQESSGWEFGEVNVEGGNPLYTFPNRGNYLILLMARNGKKNNQMSGTIEVQNPVSGIYEATSSIKAGVTTPSDSLNISINFKECIGDDNCELEVFEGDSLRETISYEILKEGTLLQEYDSTGLPTEGSLINSLTFTSIVISFADSNEVLEAITFTKK